MERGGNPVDGSGGKPIQRLQTTEGISSSQESKGAKGNRSIRERISDFVRQIFNRISYAWSKRSYSMEQVQVADALKVRESNKTFKENNVISVEPATRSKSIYPVDSQKSSDAQDMYGIEIEEASNSDRDFDEVSSSEGGFDIVDADVTSPPPSKTTEKSSEYTNVGPYGIKDQLDKINKDSENETLKNRYYSFNLSTTHKVLGVKSESHNVSVLYDAEKLRLYVIDGKANETESLHFQDKQKNQRDETVAHFVEYLKEELGLDEGEIAYCKTALQRTNDCVIFPEKVMADLINDKGTGSAQDRLDNVLAKAKTDTDAFYGEINAIRDKCFNN